MKTIYTIFAVMLGLSEVSGMLDHGDSTNNIEAITFDSPELKHLLKRYMKHVMRKGNGTCVCEPSVNLSENTFTAAFYRMLHPCFSIVFNFQSKEFTIHGDNPEIQEVLKEKFNTPLDIVQIPENFFHGKLRAFNGIELRNDMSPVEMLKAIEWSTNTYFFYSYEKDKLISL
ncbi:MAG: hypothetical protein LBB29_00750 [Holosporaceae bacterium]|jgi:hypothetical protein|nr:hypothetical protein [Holosporaceae bacterium]